MHPLIFLYTKIVDAIKNGGPHALSAALLIVAAIQYQQNTALQSKYDALLKDYIQAVRSTPNMPRSFSDKVAEYADMQQEKQ